MKKVNTKYKAIGNYAGGSDLSEIAKYLRAQMTGFKPLTVPKGMFAGAAIAQAGALGSHLIGIGGQRTSEVPFIPNPTDVNQAFQKTPGSSLGLLDNFFQGQQSGLARHAASQGADAYTTGNLLSQPMTSAANTRSQAAVGLQNENTAIDRQRGQFNIQVGQGIQQAQNLEGQNENQKLAMLTSKLSEGLGAFNNLNNETFLKKQQVEQMNNAKLSQLMNQLFTVNYLDKLYS